MSLAVKILPSKERTYAMLPKEAIKEYKTLFKRHYGINLNEADASFRANALVNLFKAVYTGESPGVIEKISHQLKERKTLSNNQEHVI